MRYRQRTGWMTLCLGVFLFRVLGQLAVAQGNLHWLPPMDQWYSGLIPYGVLVPIQIVLLMLMTVVISHLHFGLPALVPQRLQTRLWIRRFAWTYLAVMIFRYPLVMILNPELRWLGQTIPIFTHWCLAAYLLLLADGPTRGTQQSDTGFLNIGSKLRQSAL